MKTRKLKDKVVKLYAGPLNVKDKINELADHKFKKKNKHYYIRDKITAIWLVGKSAIISLIALDLHKKARWWVPHLIVNANISISMQFTCMTENVSNETKPKKKKQ